MQAVTTIGLDMRSRYFRCTVSPGLPQALSSLGRDEALNSPH